MDEADTKREAELRELVEAMPRTLGRLATESGLHLELLAGMMDAELTLGAFVNALVLLGNLPQVQAQAPGSGRLILVEHDDTWEVSGS